MIQRKNYTEKEDDKEIWIKENIYNEDIYQQTQRN